MYTSNLNDYWIELTENFNTKNTFSFYYTVKTRVGKIVLLPIKPRETEIKDRVDIKKIVIHCFFKQK